MTSKFAVGINVEIVDEAIGARDDAVHGLQADIPCRAAPGRTDGMSRPARRGRVHVETVPGTPCPTLTVVVHAGREQPRETGSGSTRQAATRRCLPASNHHQVVASLPA